MLATSRWESEPVANTRVNIIPDSLITRDWVLSGIKKYTRNFKERDIPTILFVDEAHRYKNDDAARTKALFGKDGKSGIAGHFDKVVYLSGTPMPNRPIELFSVLNHSASETIMHRNKFEYAEWFCAAYRDHFGWNFNGASHLTELSAHVIGKFMLRYKKEDVLKELPEKIEEVIIVGSDLTPKLLKQSQKLLAEYSPEDLMKNQIKVALGKEELALSTYRKELGLLKAQAAADYIKFLLEETEEAILVFAIHKDVIAILEKELSKYWPLVITGETRMELRHEHVKHFQIDQRRRLFIGNIQAAGVGLTLTKASRVVFVEFSWVPADNDQASDRAHRIGQDSRVLTQYLVHKDSIDRSVIETILRKKRVTSYV